MYCIDSISEDERLIEIELTFNQKKGSNFADLTELNVLDSKYLSVQVHIFIDDSPEESCSLNEVETKVFAMAEDLEEEQSIRVNITALKHDDRFLRIFLPDLFVSKIDLRPKQLIAFWNTVFDKFDYISLQLNEISLTQRLECNADLDTQSVFNNTELKKNLNFTPEECWQLKEAYADNPELEEHFTHLTLAFCISLLASHIDYESDNKFIFEGYGRCEINIEIDEGTEKLSEPVSVMYTAYQWVFADKNISTKLGILRNILSLNSEHLVDKVFDRNFLKVLFSNYQIYLKDNITKYIEVKNKAIEIINGLNEDLTDNYYSFKKSVRSSAIAIFTYFFTVILIRFLASKKHSVAIIDFEIVLLTVLFSFGAVAYIFKLKNDVEIYSTFCKKRLSSVNEQYKGVLSDAERKEVFSEELLMDFQEENDNSEEHWLWIYLIIILNIVLYFIAMHNLAAEL